jgi:hypothetical protein
MREQLERTAEMIIDKHKANEGTLVWHKSTFSRVTGTTAAKQYLIDLGLISSVDALNRTTSLTQKGWDFESFRKEEQKYKPDIEKLNLEIIKLRNEVFDYQKVKRNTTIAIWIAAIAALATIAQAIIASLN